MTEKRKRMFPVVGIMICVMLCCIVSLDTLAKETREKKIQTEENVTDVMSSDEEETSGFLLILEDGVREKDIQDAVEGEGIISAEVEELGNGIASVSFPDGTGQKNPVETLDALDGVISAEPDSRQYFDGYTNDPEISAEKYTANRHKFHYIFQLGLAGPGVTAWDYATGKGVNVAVFDSGANVEHQDLKGNVAGCYNAATGEAGAEAVRDSNGHGSMTAGILASVGNNQFQAAGAACEANLYVVKVVRDDGYVYSSDVIRAIDWAVQKKCRVVSYSMGGETGSEAERLAIQKAAEKGTLFVCSGGNASKQEYHYPASYPETVGVSAVNYSKASGYTISPSSTYNDQIDIAAPGSGIYGVSNTSNTELKAGGATSAAAPYVAGIAALIFQTDPSLTPQECKEILTSTAADAGDQGYDMKYGHGIIEPLRAVQKARYKSDSRARSIAGVKKNVTRTLSSKSIKLSPRTEGSGTFFFRSSNTKVAKTSGNMVKLTGIGKAVITVSIGQSGIFGAASVKMTLTVTPDKVSIKKPKAGKRHLTVGWKPQNHVSGYQVAAARNKSFIKGKRTTLIKSRKSKKRTIKKLSEGTWYVKVRSYKITGGKKIYGPWSSVRKVKVK